MFFKGFILYACVAFVLADQRASRLVATTQGIVRGYQAPGGHYEFLGIPYATAPTGPNKYRVSTFTNCAFFNCHEYCCHMMLYFIFTTNSFIIPLILNRNINN